jgi:hypothetical protein
MVERLKPLRDEGAKLLKLVTESQDLQTLEQTLELGTARRLHADPGVTNLQRQRLFGFLGGSGELGQTGTAQFRIIDRFGHLLCSAFVDTSAPAWRCHEVRHLAKGLAGPVEFHEFVTR